MQRIRLTSKMQDIGFRNNRIMRRLRIQAFHHAEYQSLLFCDLHVENLNEIFLNVNTL